MKRSGALLAVLALSCGASGEVRDQWLISVGTDVPVPRIGDRLLLEVLNRQGEIACSGCRRLLGTGSPEDWPVSFGIVQSDDATFVRARLYRSTITGAAGLPQGAALIDAIGRLPSEASGRETGSLALKASCFGQAADPVSGTTCVDGRMQEAPMLAPGDLPGVGSSPLFAEGTCPDVPEKMVCVPGGAFILGAPYADSASAELASRPEHLVRLGAFAIDVDEFSVGELRQALDVLEVREQPESKAVDSDLRAGCTFLGPNDDTNDAAPANCVSRFAAQKLCQAQGKRLPTEAEWEYVAGNLTAETPYPWGTDDDVCSLAVVARGRAGFETTLYEEDGCRSATSAEILPWGAAAGGDPEDVTELGVRNLAGNVSEFVSGEFAAYDEPCWDGAVLTDPECDTTDSDPFWAGSLPARGASWASAKEEAKATSRTALGAPGISPYHGFRCAMSF